MTRSAKKLWHLGRTSIRALETERGILASGRNELYGCLFGRDSLISALSLLKVYERTGESYYLLLVQKILHNLAQLQGTTVVIESGEEPGKIIHEFRPEQHEHLTGRPEKPWYLYPDLVMRNYDSVDSTPLFLIALDAYGSVSDDENALQPFLPSARAALDWILQYGDSNGDGLIDYRFHPERLSGGLSTQSWMDSAESLFFEEDDTQPQYPIAPMEVQAYTYFALRAWAPRLASVDSAYAENLSRRAAELKQTFARFVITEKRGRVSLAFAIDGIGRLLISPRSSMGHSLWAARLAEGNAGPDSILDADLIPAIVRRVLSPDLYAPGAGIRTLSLRSRKYQANSYHNGSIWPHDTAMIAEGLEKFGFDDEARRVRRALMRAYRHFNTPIELFVYDRGLREYSGPNGQAACRVQAWSAASLLSIIEGA